MSAQFQNNLLSGQTFHNKANNKKYTLYLTEDKKIYYIYESRSNNKWVKYDKAYVYNDIGECLIHHFRGFVSELVTSDGNYLFTNNENVEKMFDETKYGVSSNPHSMDSATQLDNMDIEIVERPKHGVLYETPNKLKLIVTVAKSGLYIVSKTPTVGDCMITYPEQYTSMDTIMVKYIDFWIAAGLIKCVQKPKYDLCKKYIGRILMHNNNTNTYIITKAGPMHEDGGYSLFKFRIGYGYQIIGTSCGVKECNLDDEQLVKFNLCVSGSDEYVK